MPYIYEDAEKRVKDPTVGTRQCVALVKTFTNAPASSMWHEGEAVKGNLMLKKGTAIATFVNGRYQNHAHGNHAAFYISQNAGGVWVVEQWSNSGTIQKNYLKFLGSNKAGQFVNPSRNGDAFSVVK